jgi:hypothetical protein
MALTCPECGLFTPASTVRSDCGFSSGIDDAGPRPELSAIQATKALQLTPRFWTFAFADVTGDRGAHAVSLLTAAPLLWADLALARKPNLRRIRRVLVEGGLVAPSLAIFALVLASPDGTLIAHRQFSRSRANSLTISS